MTKFFIKKYLYFILVFFAVMFLDYIFFAGLFTQVFQNPPDNFIVAMGSLLVALFIIPAVVSYRLIFKFDKNQLEEQTGKKLNNKTIAIGMTVFLVVILFFVFTKLPAATFEPYTFTTVSDNEFTQPVKIIATKDINGEKYYLEENKNNTVSLLQKIGADKKNDKYLYDLPLEPTFVTDFWYDSLSGTVFAIENRNLNFRNRMEQIFKFSFNAKNEQDRIRVLKTASLGVYSGSDRILNYFPQSDSLLMFAAGGDGCGGWGSIWMLTGEISRTLQSFASGCAEKDLPRYVGYDGEFLYFAIFKSLSSDDYGIDGRLDKLYKMDPLTQKETTISVSLPESIISARLSEDNKTILFMTDKGKKFILDLKNGLELKEASLSAGVRQ